MEIETYEESLHYDKYFKTELDAFSMFEVITPQHKALYNAGRVGTKARKSTWF